MKKLFTATLMLLMLLSTASAQDLLKYNYKKNNRIYSGTERIRVTSGSKDTPVHVKLTKVLFSDGQPVYMLRMEFEDATAWKMPKNAPMTIVMTDGRNLVLKNNSDAPNMVAPKGVKNPSGNDVYLNYGEYYLEEADLKKLVSGISSIDVTKRWSADGVIKVAYKNNELGSAIAKLYETINSAKTPKEELGSNLKSLQDQSGSRLVESNVVPVSDKMSVSLVYLYYAPSNIESFDLNIYIDGYTIPFTSPVKVVTSAGETIELRQEKDLVAGRVISYPTNEQVKQMMEGVSKVSIKTTSDEVEVEFPTDEFAKVVTKLWNSLQTMAIL